MSMNRVPHVALVGCGYWGKNLARNFHQLGALAAVCDVTEPGRAAALAIAPSIPVVGTLEEILRRPLCGIVVATPAETHFDIARRALQAGKDVFIEKPLALIYEHGAALVRMAEESKAVLMVGHVLEYHPAVVKLLEMVRSGVLGSIRYISSNRLNLGKIRREENILWSFAPHDIAVTLRLMKSMPFEVAAHGGSYLQPNIADVTLTHLLFNDGVRAHVYVSWLHPFKEQRLVVVGSKKMASFDDVTKRLLLYDQRVELKKGQPVPIKGHGDAVAFSDAEPLLLECQAFLDAIVSRQSPITDGDSGLRVLQVLQAAERSLLMNGKPVRLSIQNYIEKGMAA